jgi:antitoxin StbD
LWVILYEPHTNNSRKNHRQHDIFKAQSKQDYGDCRGSSVAVLNHNKPEAYLLSAKAYEALLELIDDVSLIKTIQAIKGGKTVKVKLADL